MRILLVLVTIAIAYPFSTLISFEPSSIIAHLTPQKKQSKSAKKNTPIQSSQVAALSAAQPNLADPIGLTVHAAFLYWKAQMENQDVLVTTINDNALAGTVPITGQTLVQGPYYGVDRKYNPAFKAGFGYIFNYDR